MRKRTLAVYHRRSWSNLTEIAVAQVRYVRLAENEYTRKVRNRSDRRAGRSIEISTTQ
jgi:hypothetical protein